MYYAKTILKNLVTTLQDNLEVIGKLLIAVWFFFVGIHTYIYTILVLVLIDAVTGVVKAAKLGEGFKSRKLRKGLLEKLAVYLVLLVSVFFLDRLTQSVLNHGGNYFAFFITFLITCYEVSSILENLNSIKPGLPFLSGLVRIFKKMGDSAMDKMEQNVEHIADAVTIITPNVIINPPVPPNGQNQPTENIPSSPETEKGS
jgi:toxin secretion/phage lysis holin